METETLKKIAEYMGYETKVCDYPPAFKGELQITKEGMDYYNWYRPLTNNDQMVEIMEKLVRENIGIGFAPLVNNKIHLCVDVYEGVIKEIIREGKTINEAVLNAASELVKDK